MPITLRRRLSRRGLLRSGAAAAVAMTALALVGCTNDDAERRDASSSEAQAATGAASPSRQPRQAASDESPTHGTARAQTDSVGPPDRSPRRFGVIRYFIAPDRVDTWDPLRSRSRFVQRVHALTYNRLLRPTAPNSPSPGRQTYATATRRWTRNPSSSIWPAKPNSLTSRSHQTVRSSRTMYGSASNVAPAKRTPPSGRRCRASISANPTTATTASG